MECSGDATEDEDGLALDDTDFLLGDGLLGYDEDRVDALDGDETGDRPDPSWGGRFLLRRKRFMVGDDRRALAVCVCVVVVVVVGAID